MRRDEGLAGHTGLSGSGLLDGVASRLAVFGVGGVGLSAVDALDVCASPLGTLEFGKRASSVLASLAVCRVFVGGMFRGAAIGASDLTGIVGLSTKFPTPVTLFEVDLFLPCNRANFGSEHNGHRGE